MMLVFLAVSMRCLSLSGTESESWWVDVKVNLFYCFWRARVQSSSHPTILFYKITGTNRGEWRGFEPNYSAVTTPPPFWWQDTPAGGYEF